MRGARTGPERIGCRSNCDPHALGRSRATATSLVRKPLLRYMLRSFFSLVYNFSMLLAVATASAQLPSSYSPFDRKDGSASQSRAMRTLRPGGTIVFVGVHNSAPAHWLLLDRTRMLVEERPTVMGPEMNKANYQVAKDKYQRGEVDQAASETMSCLWKNHTRPYGPSVVDQDLPRTH